MKLDTLETFLKLLKKRTDEGKIIWKTSDYCAIINGDAYSNYYLEISTILISIFVKQAWYSDPIRYICNINDACEYSTEVHKKFALKKANRKYHISIPLGLDETLIPSLYEAAEKQSIEAYKKMSKKKNKKQN